MSVLWSDLRVAVRVLMKAPGLTLAAVFTLALGIGPNTAIFSVVYGTLLAPLPYADPEQLVIVWSQVSSNRSPTSPADYLEWKERASTFQYLEPVWPRNFNLATPEAPQRVRARQTSPDGYRMFGERVSLGRDFAPDEHQPGKNHVVLLSHELWRRSFGADPGIVGRDIRMDSTPYTVVGVMQPGVNDRLPAHLWIPLTFTPEQLANRNLRPLLVLGRLKPGVTAQQAQQEMNIIAGDIARRFPASNKNVGVRVEPLQNNFLSADTRTSLWLLLMAVSFVVLIACVNVANLLLSRGVARERETAIRTALGATRGRVVRQALTESLVLAAVGAILGVLSSVWILRGILAVLPPFTLPAEADPRLSLPVLLFTLAATVVSGLLFGSAPAWQAGRVDVNETLKHAGRNAAAGGRRRIGQALVLGQLALAVTLVTGAGLTILSFWNRTQFDLGIRTDRIVTFVLPVSEERFSSAGQIDTFYQQLLERLHAVPGALHATVTAPTLPLLGAGFPIQFDLVGDPADSPSSRPRASVQMVSPGYFETFGIRMRRGRSLTERDGAGSLRVAVVNERFVELFLQGRDPLRQRLTMDSVARGPRMPATAEWEIVGVFGNVANVARFGDPEAPQIYVPFAQSPWPEVMVAVRTAGEPEALASSLRAAVQSLDAELPLTNFSQGALSREAFQTMEQVVGVGFALDRMKIALFGGLAVLALLLAALGIYGVMAFAVAQRTQEIGLRMALGAGQSQVRTQILREGLTLAMGGLAVGLVGAYGLSRAMQSTLFGIGGLSLTVLAAAGTVLIATALIACYVPARRASAVEPMIALRQD